MNGEKIEIKKGEVMAALQALAQISNYPLPERTAYWLGRNFKQLEMESKKIAMEHLEIVKKHGGVQIPNGGYQVPETIKEGEKDVPNPALKDLQDDYDKLMSEEIEVDIMKVNLASNNITMNARMALDFMLEDPREGTLLVMPGPAQRM